jgi:hypothetical protein
LLDAWIGYYSGFPILRHPRPTIRQCLALDDYLPAIRIGPQQMLEFTAPQAEKDPGYDKAVELRVESTAGTPLDGLLRHS